MFLPECFRIHEGVLEGIAARSASDIWAVGWQYDHNNNDAIRPLTLHWNGTCWSEVWCNTMGEGARLFAVAVIPPSDAWAVGHYGDFILGVPRNLTFVLRWDGNFNVWQFSPSSNLPNGDNFLWGVSGTTRQDIWAVGDYEPDIGNWQTMTQHWDGAGWAIVPSPNVGDQQTANALNSVVALSSRYAWAAGIGGGSHTLIERWDGRKWSVVPSQDAPDTAMYGWNQLLGIAAKSPKDIWTVGHYFPSNITLEALTLRGPKYAPHPVFPGAQQLDQHWLRGVAIDPQDHAWAVGGIRTNAQNNASKTLITRWSGSGWELVDSADVGIASGLSGVSAVSDKDIWAVGWYALPNHTYPFCLIEHWNGTKWTVFP
jgi:hypothetical protein